MYNEDGSLRQKVFMISGKVNGKYEYYTISGTIFQKGNAIDDFQSGACAEYYYEGELRKNIL